MHDVLPHLAEVEAVVPLLGLGQAVVPLGLGLDQAAQVSQQAQAFAQEH